MISLVNERRYDLDWLRIAAFGLLIFYHVGMLFVPWEFHIKTAHPQRWVEAPMLLLNPWRLSLLFLISGAASRFLLAKAGGLGTFAGSRTKRLLLPLVFGMAVVLPPQAWVDLTVNHGYRAGFWAFWAGNYWRFDKSLGIDVPTWNHLWFVAYLWVYSLLLAALLAFVPAALRERLQASFDRLFTGWRLMALPVLWFAALRIWLFPHFPETHGLFDDWYDHVAYGSVFAFGFVLARSHTAWATIARVWPLAGTAALTAWVIVAGVDLGLPEKAGLGDAALTLLRTVRTVAMWGAILGLLGFAQRYWNRDHPWRATLTEAVFPAYIAHQTIILVVEYLLRPLALGAGAEFVILVITTVTGSALFYLIARSVRWLRPLAGLQSAQQPVASRSKREGPQAPKQPASTVHPI